MIPPQVQAEILRLYHAEKWRVGTIAAQLGVHHSVVKRLLAQEGTPRPKRCRPARLAPYLPLILATWRQYPKLPASRLYEMCRQRGYRGDAILFNPLLLEFARHYRYAPRPVAPSRGNEKGRVEKAISYVRSAFFMARRFKDLDDLNRQARQWCDGPACQRRWVEDDRLTVGEAFEKERGLFLPLPDAPIPTDERGELPVGKTPYVRFDHNDYSVPHERVHQTVMVIASPTTVRIMYRGLDRLATATPPIRPCSAATRCCAATPARCSTISPPRTPPPYDSRAWSPTARVERDTLTESGSFCPCPCLSLAEARLLPLAMSSSRLTLRFHDRIRMRPQNRRIPALLDRRQHATCAG